MESHKKVYTERSTSGMSASSMGSAAAMEVRPLAIIPASAFAGSYTTTCCRS